MRRSLAVLLLVALGLHALAPAVHSEEPLAVPPDVAILASRSGDRAVPGLGERRERVAPVASFLLARASLPAPTDDDRAALLRAEAVLARAGSAGVHALLALAPVESTARACVARAVARASEASLDREPEAARAGGERLARLLLPDARVALPDEDLLLSGRVTERTFDEDGVARALGALAPVAVPLVTPLLEHEDGATRLLAVRALGAARARRADACRALGRALARTSRAEERRAIASALVELGGAEASEPLATALAEGPREERLARIRDLSRARDFAIAPRAIARGLALLEADELLPALELLGEVGTPPPPRPKARFVADPHRERRTATARVSRDEGRAAAVRLLVHPSRAVRLGAARCLEALGAPENADRARELGRALLERFELEEDRAIQASLARSLDGLLPAGELARPFTAALSFPAPPGARDELVAAVLRSGVTLRSSVTADEPALLAGLLRDTALAPEVRALAAVALLARARDVVEGARRSSADPLVRACAAAALAGELAPTVAADLLDEAAAPTRSASALERAAGVVILAHAAGRNAQGIVAAVSRNDSSPFVRLAGTEAIAVCYSRAGAGTLAQALSDRERPVRMAAARSLARTGEPNVAGALVAAIVRAHERRDDEEQSLLRRALSSLDKDSVPSLGNVARQSRSSLERSVAIERLGEIATDEAIAMLVLVLRAPRERGDADRAHVALVRATGRDLFDPTWDPFR